MAFFHLERDYRWKPRTLLLARLFDLLPLAILAVFFLLLLSIRELSDAGIPLKTFELASFFILEKDCRYFIIWIFKWGRSDRNWTFFHNFKSVIFFLLARVFTFNLSLSRSLSLSLSLVSSEIKWIIIYICNPCSL